MPPLGAGVPPEWKLYLEPGREEAPERRPARGSLLQGYTFVMLSEGGEGGGVPAACRLDYDVIVHAKGRWVVSMGQAGGVKQGSHRVQTGGQ